MNKEAWFMQRQIEKQDWDYPPKCSVCGSDTPQHDCAIVLHGRLASTNEALIQIEQLACGQNNRPAPCKEYGK